MRPSTTTRKPDYLLTTRRTLDDRFDQRPPDQYPPDMYPSAPPAPTEPSTTFRYEEEEVESECISSVKTFRPKMMNNYLNQMTKVVNNSNFTHLVPYNECTWASMRVTSFNLFLRFWKTFKLCFSSIDEPCHSCCPAPRGYRNMCRPTYSQTLLFAQLTDGTIYRDSFYFPGPCKCAMMRRKTRQTTNAPLTWLFFSSIKL